jgi:hypothetical protein
VPQLVLQRAQRALLQVSQRRVHVTEAEALHVVCYEHLVTDRLQRAFTHLHPAHASQFSLLKREYLRFIVLKLLEKDTGAQSKLSPSKTVEDLWQTHMLVSRRNNTVRV